MRGATVTVIRPGAAVFVAQPSAGKRKAAPTLLLGRTCGMTEEETSKLCGANGETKRTIRSINRKFSRLAVGTSALAVMLMSVFQDCPKLWDGSLSTYTGVEIPIELATNAKPYIAHYAKSKIIGEKGQRDAVDRWVADGLASGLLVKCSQSSGAAIVIAPKL